MGGLRLAAVIIAAVHAFAIAAGAQNAAHQADPEAGRALALHACDTCHIVTANQQHPSPLLGYGPSFFDVANRPDVTAGSLEAFLSHPHSLGNMPSPALNAAQVADVAAYILSLRGRP